MSDILIHANPNGGVSITTPTGELPINEVLAKDCPADAIIVDNSTLPQGADAQFFGAWELNGSTVTVNFAKAQAIKLEQYNTQALQIAQQRQLNTLAGIANTISDAAFIAELTAGRNAIAAATTTTELLDIINPA